MPLDGARALGWLALQLDPRSTERRQRLAEAAALLRAAGAHAEAARLERGNVPGGGASA